MEWVAAEVAAGAVGAGGPMGACPAGGATSSGWRAQAHQQKEKAQQTSCQCRRIARSLRTMKSAQPSSSFTCL
jgi:hypothetical protein